jgi:2-dehydro-3-deoxyphosphogluconate aldolase / (4S)-4-hydroxy-2-oxoglutarate aldolase
MKTKETALQNILDQGMLPLFYCDDAAVSFEITLTLYKAGIRSLEYTNRGNAALSNFEILKQMAVKEMPDLSLGIGTIKNEEEAREFIAAGADFIVSPVMDPHIAQLSSEAGLLWVPGCMTPTEINLARRYKAALIKIFPANILGPAFISSIKDLFPGQLFIPTGGVELDQKNIRDWFVSGVCAVGMGSKLISKEIIEKRQYDLLYTNTVGALNLVKASRK